MKIGKTNQNQPKRKKMMNLMKATTSVNYFRK